MASSRGIAKAQAQRYFRSPRDVSIFLRQMRQESGFRDVTSPAGAQGPAQIMPATARGWGVTNVHDPVQAYAAAAKHMALYLHQYGGNWAKALTAYNAGPGAVGGSLPAETRNYISTILGGGSAKAGSLSLAGGSGGSRSPTPSTAAGPTTSGDPTKLALANLLGRSNPNSFLVRTLRAQGGGESPTAPSMASQMLSSLPALPSIRAAAARTPVSGAGSGSTYTGGRGRVVVSPGANRSGVSISQSVLNFDAQLAAAAGHPIRIGTGTNHNRMTTSGNVSDHWDGHASDIPASGAALTRLGQQALIVAGMDPKKARQQTGGLFNLYRGGRRIQIIFNSNIGGNHYNHLHVGVR